MELYSLPIQTQTGEIQTLAPYQNKVLLIVNTATGCGFTPQYAGLEQLYRDYHAQGFEILDFPCNQFKGQAPGSADDINQFCQLHYQTSFPRFAKIDVNGDNTAPLYRFLKQQKGGLLTDDIKWNFTKFLIDKKGNVVKRYAPQTEPASIGQDICDLLAQ